MPGIRLIGNVTIAVVLLYGGYRAFDGEVTVGVLAAFLLYLRQFFEPMHGDLAVLQHLPVRLGRAGEALRRARGGAGACPSRRSPVRAARRRGGELRFDHVRFDYVEGVPVLPGLDLTVPAGQTLALVGTTGAGKTTLAKLPPGSTTRSTARVLLDGVDLRDLPTSTTLRRAVGDGDPGELPVLRHRRRQHPLRPARRQPARSRGGGAGASAPHEFIAALPEGYDTDVANRGGRLSAGQRQLVAFARAFLADPAVLILDEATSSLDVPSERLVQRALRTILAGRTAVIIAHRLSTVEIADRVLVIEHGRIVEDGTPGQLLAGGAGSPTCTRAGGELWPDEARLGAGPAAGVAVCRS